MFTDFKLCMTFEYFFFVSTKLLYLLNLILFF